MNDNGKPTRSQPLNKLEPLKDRTTLPFQKNLSHEKLQPVQGKYASKSRFATKNASKTNKYDDRVNSSIEKLHDSLEDPSAIDSGLGSSCEYKTKVKITWTQFSS